MELTCHQQSLVNHDGEHALCIAVPGSGKTSTLVHRVQALLKSGAQAQRIMVMMFNKSAQLDFTAKLQNLCSEHLILPEIRTYHSTGLRLLKNLEKWGLRTPYNSTPLSDKEIELKIRDLLLQKAPVALRDRIRNDSAKYIEAAISFIDGVKSSLTSPEAVFKQSGLPQDFAFFIKLFSDFEQWRHDQRAITFTDMLYDPVCMIDANPDILPRIENKMDCIIVDEYQDTSTLQHRLTQIIAGSRANIMAVGDPDQTIYEFAGANIDNVLHHFENDFSVTGSINKLSMPHTFRYGHSIALAASHLISQNRARKNVVCIPHPGNKPSSVELRLCDDDDTNEVLKVIHQHRQENINSKQLAVLVRVWAQAVPIELSLLEQGIPYYSEGPSLFDRPEIAALVAVLELASGQLGLMSEQDRQTRLKKILTLPHIGVKSIWVSQIVEQLKHLEHGFGKALSDCSEQIHSVSDYQLKKLKERARILQQLEKSASHRSAEELLKTYILQSEFRESLESMSLNDQRTQEQLMAVEGFLSWLKGISLTAFESCLHIQELRVKRSSSNRRNKSSEAIQISSCHKAKGLEWPVVLLPGLTTQYWPFTRGDELAAARANSLESERRLLYVAMTRARQKLVLFTKKTSQENSSESWADRKAKTTSPFVTEMQLPIIKKLADSLQKANDEELIEIIGSSPLTEATKLYLKQVKPELCPEIDKAPSSEKPQRTRPEKRKRSTNDHRDSQRHRTTMVTKQRAISDPTAPWQPRVRIRHSIFGEGLVTEVNDTSFMITFDNHHGAKRFARNEEVRHLFELISPAPVIDQQTVES